MAINKNFTTPQGVLTTFHEIIRVEINASAACVSMYVNCYTSEEDKALGSSPVWQECIVIPCAEFVTNPLDVFYTACVDHTGSTFNGGLLNE